jgi:deoxyxylulose-5-phosphate synthase
VLDVLNQAGVHAPVLKVALSEGFVDHGSVDALRRQQRIDTAGIVSRIREALGIDVAADESRAPTSTAA